MGYVVQMAFVATAWLAQDETYDGRSTEATVRLVVGGLVAIAVATAVLTLVYVWHTSPRRRQRIASRRVGPPAGEPVGADEPLAEPVGADEPPTD